MYEDCHKKGSTLTSKCKMIFWKTLTEAMKVSWRAEMPKIIVDKKRLYADRMSGIQP